MTKILIQSLLPRLIILPILIISTMESLGQNTGIGTTDPQNKLHVAGGLRVDTLVSGIDSGLLRHDKSGTIYSLKFTSNPGDVLRGDGKFSSLGGSSGAWVLNGNAGTNPANNFIGTTDVQALKFRVNNITSGEIQPSTGNTSIGMNTLKLTTTGFNNSAFGFNCFSSNTIGSYNTAIGSAALQNNTSGNDNSVNGSFAMLSNTTGKENTVNGASAMYSNTSGSGNTANGWNALWSNTAGFSNVAVGIGALRNNTTGHNLVAIGDSALFNQIVNPVNSYLNTAVGSKVLFSNTTGRGNTGIGSVALFANNTGDYNTALGHASLPNNNNGDYNTAAGYLALGSNTTGNANTAIGSSALQLNDDGNNNTAIGTSSLLNNNSGTHNTAIGLQALMNNTSGGFNTAVGYNANVSTGNLSNATAIGFGAVVNVSNKVRLGNISVTVIEGQVPFTSPSDGRFKSNIQNDVQGLNFILKLKPVSYQFNYTVFADFLGEKNIDKIGLEQKEKNRQMGFVAQEVEKICIELGIDITNLVFKPDNEKGNYSLAYSQFVVPLVKAVQEQQLMIEELKIKNETVSEMQLKILKQQNTIDELSLRLEKLEVQLSGKK